MGSNSWNRPIIGRNYAVVANFKVRNYRLQKFQIHETDLEPNYVVATYTPVLNLNEGIPPDAHAW